MRNVLAIGAALAVALALAGAVRAADLRIATLTALSPTLTVWYLTR